MDGKVIKMFGVRIKWPFNQNERANQLRTVEGRTVILRTIKTLMRKHCNVQSAQLKVHSKSISTYFFDGHNFSIIEYGLYRQNQSLNKKKI